MPPLLKNSSNLKSSPFKCGQTKGVKSSLKVLSRRFSRGLKIKNHYESFNPTASLSSMHQDFVSKHDKVAFSTYYKVVAHLRSTSDIKAKIEEHILNLKSSGKSKMTSLKKMYHDFLKSNEKVSFSTYHSVNRKLAEKQESVSTDNGHVTTNLALNIKKEEYVQSETTVKTEPELGKEKTDLNFNNDPNQLNGSFYNVYHINYFTIRDHILQCKSASKGSSRLSLKSMHDDFLEKHAFVSYSTYYKVATQIGAILPKKKGQDSIRFSTSQTRASVRISLLTTEVNSQSLRVCQRNFDHVKEYILKVVKKEQSLVDLEPMPQKLSFKSMYEDYISQNPMISYALFYRIASKLCVIRSCEERITDHLIRYSYEEGLHFQKIDTKMVNVLHNDFCSVNEQVSFSTFYNVVVKMCKKSSENQN